MNKVNQSAILRGKLASKLMKIKYSHQEYCYSWLTGFLPMNIMNKREVNALYIWLSLIIKIFEFKSGLKCQNLIGELSHSYCREIMLVVVPNSFKCRQKRIVFCSYWQYSFGIRSFGIQIKNVKSLTLPVLWKRIFNEYSNSTGERRLLFIIGIISGYNIWQI